MPLFTRDPDALWVRTAVGLWAVVAVLVCGRAFLVDSTKHAGIYPVFRKAGADWASGKPVYLEVDSFFTFRYAPVYAVAFVPFAEVPPVVGCLVWRGLLVGVFLWSAIGWISRSGAAPREVGAFLSLVAPLAAWDMINGMTNALLAALLLLAVTDLGRERWWRASVWLTLACLMKLYPVAFVALLLLVYPRQLGWRFPLVLVVGLAVPFLLQDPDYVVRQYESWARTVAADDGRQENSLETSYRDVRLLFRAWGEPLSPAAYRVLQLAGGVLAAGVCFVRHRFGRDPAATRFTVLAFGTLWMTVLGPSTEGITYALLGPAMAWAAVSAVFRPTLWGVRVPILAGYGLMAASFLAFLFPFGKPFAVLGPQPAAALVFGFGLLAAEVAAFRRRADPLSDPSRA